MASEDHRQDKTQSVAWKHFRVNVGLLLTSRMMKAPQT